MTVQADPTRHRRSRAVSISMATALATIGLASCSSGSDYRAACVNQSTQARVNDSDCNANRAGTGWYYFPRGAAFPGLGSRIGGGGSFTAPAAGTSVSRGGLDAKGGTISRGGFGGGSSKAVGG